MSILLTWITSSSSLFPAVTCLVCRNLGCAFLLSLSLFRLLLCGLRCSRCSWSADWLGVYKSMRVLLNSLSLSYSQSQHTSLQCGLILLWSWCDKTIETFSQVSSDSRACNVAFHPWWYNSVLSHMLALSSVFLSNISFFFFPCRYYFLGLLVGKLLSPSLIAQTSFWVVTIWALLREIYWS